MARDLQTARAVRHLTLALLLIGCGGRLASTAGDVSAPPTVVFAPGWVGYSTTATLTLHNESASPRDLKLDLPAPFAVDTAEQRLQGGESRDVAITFAPTEPGAYELDAKLSGDLQGTVHLSARANIAPDCTPSNTCVSSHFDATTGTCVTASLADGTSCADPCIEGGVCMHGTCMGTAKNCDDGNACTSDACGAQGCVHTDVTASCPRPNDPCQAAYCDPVMGCGSELVADGTSCGTNDCVTAHVCIQGQCLARAAPDGSVCASASICQGEGLCHAGACQQPQGTTLIPKWEYNQPMAYSASGSIAADDSGNLYFTQYITQECETCEAVNPGPYCQVVSVDPNGGVRWTHISAGSCYRFALDAANAQLYLPEGAGSVVVALALADGSARWQFDLTGHNLRSRRKEPAGLYRPVQSLVLAGDTGPLFLAADDETSDVKWVIGVDRVTGTMLFDQRYAGSLSELAGDSQGAVFISTDETGASTLTRLGDQGQVSLSTPLPAGSSQLALEQFGQVLLSESGTGLSWYDSNRGKAGASLAAPVWGYYAADPYTLWTTARLVYELPDLNTNKLRAYDTTTGQTLATIDYELTKTVGDLMVTDRGSGLLVLQDDSGLHGTTSLFEADTRGRVLMQCALEHEGVSGSLLLDGSLYVLTATGISAYDLPGYRLGRTGWVTSAGNPHRDWQAR